MPADHIIVHDTRLEGQVFRHPELHVIETHCEPIAQIAARIRGATTVSASMNMSQTTVPVPVLSIFAHGADITSGPVDWAMQLGLEYVHLNNAYQFGRSIRGCVSDRIRVMCCNGSRTDDAQAACRALAAGAGAHVYAATTNQDYGMPETMRTFGGYVISPAHPRGGWINFGQWEGSVYVFPPDGGPGRLSFEGPAPAVRPGGNGTSQGDICN